MAALTLADMDIYKIARCIGHATVDLGALCASIKVNMWSKKRPIAVNQDEDLTDTVRKAANWGYTITAYNSLANLMAAARTLGVGKPGWGNNKPSASCPKYRMHDFIGYDHDAEPPFPWQCAAQGKTIYRSGKVRFYLGEEVEGALTQADFPTANSIYGCKIGMAIRRTDETTVRARCTFDTLTAVDEGIYDILATAFSVGGTGSYEAVLFFCTQSIELLGDEPAATFYLLPYPYFTFYYNNATGVMVWGDSIVRNYGGNRRFEFAFHLTQQGDLQTVSGIQVYCLAKSAQNTDWSVSNGVYNIPGTTAPSGSTPATVQKVTIGSVSVASYTTLVQFDIDGDDWPDDYHIVFEYSVGGQTYWVTDSLDDDDESPEE